MGWFSNLFRREQTQAEQAQADQYQQLFSSFDRASMLNATPEQLSANRAQLHDLFSSRTWNSLDYDTKCQAVQALENDFAYQQSRPAKTVEVTSLRDGCFGGWNAGRDTIRLNENLLKSGTLSSNPNAQPMPDANMQIFDTVAHEGYHAYQSYALEHPEVHADKTQLREWALNEGKYYGNGDKYLIQPQERDAWQYGYSSTTQAFQGIEARNGPEPELPKAEYENNALASSYNAALAREQRRDPQVLQTMEKEMETACQQQGIKYDFTGQSQTAANAPQPQAQGVQQGQAPPDMAQAAAVQAAQAPDGQLRQDAQQEQTQAENQEQVQNENQEQAQGENQEQAQGENQEQTQGENQEQTQSESQEQAQSESQEQVQGENQEQVQGENQEQVQGENQEQVQGESQEQTQAEEQEQAPQEEQSQTDDLSMDQAAEQTPQEEQAQTDDLSMDQAAEQVPQEEQAQADDLSMDQAAEQTPQEEQAQTDDLSMDQAAGEDVSADQGQDSSAGEEQSSGEEEDQSQGYSY